jgi:hypothetical protein
MDALMSAVTLKAHYDGERIVLDEPFELPANARLVVTVLSSDPERTEWSEVAMRGLAGAYGEAEPEYSSEDIRKQP